MEKIYTHSGHTNCYTYFCVKGDFAPEVISEMLGLVPAGFNKIGDKRNDGKAYDFASWEFGKCDHYDVVADSLMMKTISPLIPKTDVLKEIKRRFDVSFTLEVVATVCFDEPAPCLAPSLEVMRFCCDTGTEMDIDLYVSCPDDFMGGVILQNE